LYDWLTHSVTALGTAGERSAASLSQLKGVRDRVREERGASGGSAESRRAAGDAAPKTDARARFDAGKPTEGTIGDISASLGGAEAGPESQSVGKQGVKPSGAGKESKDSEQDMTSRLLAAKRRARQSRKKDDESDQK
jgi:hypothetical protein